MLIYLLVFLISTLFYYWGTRWKGATAYILYGVAILIPSILAGCRDLSVGRDMDTYVINVWDVVSNTHNISESVMYLPIIEPLYIGLNYAVSRFTNDIHWFLFVHMLILMILTVLSAHKYRKTGMSYLLVAFVLLYLYNTSLTMMRQAIAVFIVFYGCTFLQEKKILKFYLCIFVAYFAHYSAIFIALLYPIILLLENFNRKRITIFVCVVGGTFAIMTLYRTLMVNFISWGLLDNKYEHYIDQIGFRSHKMDLLFIGFLVAGLLIIARKIMNNTYIIDAFFLLVIAFCVTIMGDVVEVANRIAFYLLFLPVIYIIKTLNRRGAIVRFSWLLLMLLLIRWYYYALDGASDTVPYTSVILGIR